MSPATVTQVNSQDLEDIACVANAVEGLSTDACDWGIDFQTDAGFVVKMKLKVVAFSKIALPSFSELRGDLPKVQIPPASGCQVHVSKLQTLARASLVNILQL
jgi:hypothetical protein